MVGGCIMSLVSDSESESEREEEKVPTNTKVKLERNIERDVKREPGEETIGLDGLGSCSVQYGRTVCVHMSGQITLNVMNTWKNAARAMKWPLYFTDKDGQYADIIVVEDRVKIGTLLRALNNGWTELPKYVTVVKKEWVIESIESRTIMDESSPQYAHALQVLRSKDIEIAEQTKIKAQIEAQEEKRQGASSPSDAVAVTANGGEASVKMKSQPKGFLVNRNPEDTKGPSNQALQSLGYNEALYNEAAAILKLIQSKTSSFGDKANTHRQKSYTKWRDELKEYRFPIYDEDDLKEFCVNVDISLKSTIFNHFLPIVRGELGMSEKLQGLQNNPKITAMTELMGIWGVGQKTAERLIEKHSLTSLDACRKLVASGRDHPFTENQLVGIRHYEDFDERIPREEIRVIESTVQAAAVVLGAAQPRVMAVGSYRRGKRTCGDCDILVTASEGAEGDLPASFMATLIDRLSRSGFLTAHLTNPVGNREAGVLGQSNTGSRDMARVAIERARSDTKRGRGRGDDDDDDDDDDDGGGDGGGKTAREVQHHSKKQKQAQAQAVWGHEEGGKDTRNRGSYMGVCRVEATEDNPHPKYRRIDMKLYPRASFPYALLYFTGSGHFNRSMRKWCDVELRKVRPLTHPDANGFSMSDIGLHEVVRGPDGDVKLKLTTITAKTEKEIFEHLHLPYCAPHMREHSWQSNYAIPDHINTTAHGGENEEAAEEAEAEDGGRFLAAVGMGTSDYEYL